MIDPETLRCFAADGAVPTEAEARALAAEVLRLRAERDELRAVCDDLHVDVVRARDALDDMRARAERAEAERDVLRDAARDAFDADASAEEAEEAAAHAWGRASGPALDALNTASARRAAARERLRALAGEGGR